MESENNVIEGLRALATFLEENPEVPRPPFGKRHPIVAYAADIHGIRAAAKAIGGWEKEYDDNYLELTRRFGAISYQVFTPREEACTPKITEEVTEMVPDEQWINAQMTEIRKNAPVVSVTHRVVTEWNCEPLLADNVTAPSE